jgi:hypothetical protein
MAVAVGWNGRKRRRSSCPTRASAGRGVWCGRSAQSSWWETASTTPRRVAAANVGLAMGSGTGFARERADIVLLCNGLLKLVEMIGMARRTGDHHAEFVGTCGRHGRNGSCRFRLNPEGELCRMHGRRVGNVQDDRAMLTQIFAQGKAATHRDHSAGSDSGYATTRSPAARSAGCPAARRSWGRS